jgi:hypothetical protein
VADVGRRSLDGEWDELVLACGPVAKNGRRQIDLSPKAAGLAHFLRSMTLHHYEVLPNSGSGSGPARAAADLTTWHADYQGKRNEGNHLDREVENVSWVRADVMHALAESIRTSIAYGERPNFPREVVDYENESQREGRYLLRWNVYQKRSPSPWKQKIDGVLAKTGELVSEVRELDLAKKYDDRGMGYIEAHGVEPLCAGMKRSDPPRTWRFSTRTVSA